MKKKRFTEEQIVGRLLQTEQSEHAVTQVWKAYGVSEQTWYRWKKQFGQMAVPDVRRLRILEKEVHPVNPSMVLWRRRVWIDD